MRILAAAFLLAFLASSAAAASTREAAAAKHAAARRAGRLSKELRLNRAQARKLTRLLEASAVDEAALIEKLRERRGKTRAAVLSLLTSRQRDAYEAMAPSENEGDADAGVLPAAASADPAGAHPGVMVDHDTQPAPEERPAPPPARASVDESGAAHPGVMVDHDTEPPEAETEAEADAEPAPAPRRRRRAR